MQLDLSKYTCKGQLVKYIVENVNLEKSYIKVHIVTPLIQADIVYGKIENKYYMIDVTSRDVELVYEEEEDENRFSEFIRVGFDALLSFDRLNKVEVIKKNLSKDYDLSNF